MLWRWMGWSPCVTILVNFLLLIVNVENGSAAANYLASIERRQRALDATDLPCTSEVVVEVGEKYLFDSRSAIIYENAYVSQASSSEGEHYRRRRDTSYSHAADKKSKSIISKYLHQSAGYHPERTEGHSYTIPLVHHGHRQPLRPGPSHGKKHKGNGSGSYQGRAYGGDDEEETYSQDKEESSGAGESEYASGSSENSGHYSSGVSSGEGSGHDYSSGVSSGTGSGHDYSSGVSSGAGSGHDYSSGGSGSGHGYSGGSGHHSSSGNRGGGHAYLSRGSGKGHGYHSGSGYAHGRSDGYGASSGGGGYETDGEVPVGNHGLASAAYQGGGGGYGGGGVGTFGYVQPVKPAVCEWSFKAGEYCTLESHIVKFRPGDQNCYKQQFIVSDNYTSFKMCGHQELYPAFRAETPFMQVTYWRQPYTYRHVFKGYVTCVPKAHRPSFDSYYHAAGSGASDYSYNYNENYNDGYNSDSYPAGEGSGYGNSGATYTEEGSSYGGDSNYGSTGSSYDEASSSYAEGPASSGYEGDPGYAESQTEGAYEGDSGYNGGSDGGAGYGENPSGSEYEGGSTYTDTSGDNYGESSSYSGTPSESSSYISSSGGANQYSGSKMGSSFAYQEEDGPYEGTSYGEAGSSSYQGNGDQSSYSSAGGSSYSEGTASGNGYSDTYPSSYNNNNNMEVNSAVFKNDYQLPSGYYYSSPRQDYPYNAQHNQMGHPRPGYYNQAYGSGAYQGPSKHQAYDNYGYNNEDGRYPESSYYPHQQAHHSSQNYEQTYQAPEAPSVSSDSHSSYKPASSEYVDNTEKTYPSSHQTQVENYDQSYQAAEMSEDDEAYGTYEPPPPPEASGYSNNEDAYEPTYQGSPSTSESEYGEYSAGNSDQGYPSEGSYQANSPPPVASYEAPSPSHSSYQEETYEAPQPAQSPQYSSSPSHSSGHGHSSSHKIYESQDVPAQEEPYHPPPKKIIEMPIEQQEYPEVPYENPEREERPPEGALYYEPEGVPDDIPPMVPQYQVPQIPQYSPEGYQPQPAYPGMENEPPYYYTGGYPSSYPQAPSYYNPAQFQPSYTPNTYYNNAPNQQYIPRYHSTVVDPEEENYEGRAHESQNGYSIPIPSSPSVYSPLRMPDSVPAVSNVPMALNFAPPGDNYMLQPSTYQYPVASAQLAQPLSSVTNYLAPNSYPVQQQQYPVQLAPIPVMPVATAPTVSSSSPVFVKYPIGTSPQAGAVPSPVPVAVNQGEVQYLGAVPPPIMQITRIAYPKQQGAMPQQIQAAPSPLVYG